MQITHSGAMILPKWPSSAPLAMRIMQSVSGSVRFSSGAVVCIVFVLCCVVFCMGDDERDHKALQKTRPPSMNTYVYVALNTQALAEIPYYQML